MALINEVIEGARSDARFLASLAANHQSRLLGSIRTLRENILTSMSKLETTSAGKLLGVKVNLKQSQQIHRQLVNQFEKDYNIKVNTMLGDFSGVDKMITRRYKSLNESISFTSIDKVMTDTLKLSTYGRYRAFGEDARNRIASAMYNSVAGGAKMSTLVNTIRGVLTGHRDARGRPMTMYAQGFAQDAVMNYHNQVNIKKGEDLGMRHFLYYGNIIDTSRPFCITRVGKVYTKRQIMAWDSLSWKGKAGPPFPERGGYNCRHHWRPVRKEWLDDEKGEALPRNEVLGEMVVRDNTKARNLSANLSKKRGLLDKLDERESLLRQTIEERPATRKESFEALLLNNQKKLDLQKEIDALRKKIANIGRTVKPKKTITTAVETLPELSLAGAPKLDKQTKAFIGKVKYYVKNRRSVGTKSKMFGIWESMEDSAKQYFLDAWESQGIKTSKYKHLFPKGKVPLPKIKLVPKIKPVPKPKGPVTVAPPIDKQTKAFIGKVKYYVKSGKSVGVNSKMFKYWDEMEDLHKQYYIDLWESQGISVSKYSHLFPKGKVPLPKVPIVKPLGPKVPKIVPPIVKPLGPKVPKIMPGTEKLIKDTYIKIDSQIVYLEELIQLTPQVKQASFEELIAHLQQRLVVVEDINRLNQKLIAMGAKARPLPKGVAKIEKKIIEKAKEIEVQVIQFPGAPLQKREAIEAKLRKQGVSSVYDNSHYGDQFGIEEWVDNILQPMSDDMDRVLNLNPILADALDHRPVIKTGFIRGWNLEKIGYKGADGLYYGGSEQIAVASRASKSMLEPDHALQVGKRRILSDGSEIKRSYSAWNVSSESGTAASVWRHELGHHVHLSQLYGTPVWSDLGLHRRWQDIWDGTGSSWFEKNLTTYSGASVKEAFAETFAAYYSPLYKRGLLPKVLEEFMDGLSTGIYRGYNAITLENTFAEGSSIMVKKMAASEVKQIVKGLEHRPVDILASKTKSKLTSGYIRDKKGKWFLKGKAVSKAIEIRLKKMAIPPAWTKVIAAIDDKAELLAVGRDIKNKLQYRFSQKHITQGAKKKYIRIKNFRKSIPGIRKKIEAGIKKGDARAYILELENKTAIRIGTDRDLRAEVKAYGLTTLQYEHVIIKGNKIIFDFTAKKGIHAHYELTDKRLAEWLKKRKMATRKGQKLFPDVTAKKLNTYLKELANGKNYTIKDFRTYHGTRIALDELEKYPKKIYDAKQKKKIIKEVSEVVSKFLHNTPAMAKNSYIDPMVWKVIGGL